MSPLPPDIQSDVEALYTFLELAIPNQLGSGLDGLVPLIEYIKDGGSVFLLKWDGERSSRQYTAVVSHAHRAPIRFDDRAAEVAAAKTILQYARAHLGF